MLDLNKGLLLSFAVNSRSKWRPIFVTGHVPLSHTLERTARPDLPRIWLVRRFEASAGPRAFPKGTLHLNSGAIAPTFAPGFKCKFRDLTANDVCAFGRAEFGGFLCSMTESVLIKETRRLTMEDPI